MKCTEDGDEPPHPPPPPKKQKTKNKTKKTAGGKRGGNVDPDRGSGATRGVFRVYYAKGLF